MKEKNIQNTFFNQIKDRLPNNLTLVDGVADALNISNDSAYRRIRGETPLDFEEIGVLTAKYGISLDGLVKSESDTVAFRYRPLDEKSFSFENYMETTLADLEKITDQEDAEMIYVANDIPFFQLFEIQEIAAFKFFVWTKTILNYAQHKGKKLKLDEGITDKAKELGAKLIETYCKIPSIEIFHAGTLESTLNQIEYYHVSGLFSNKKDGILLCDKMSDLVGHMQRQAELGVKFSIGKELPEGILGMRSGNYQLYYNEVLATDNTILARSGDFKMSYLTNNGHNSLMTNSPVFYDNTHRSLQNLMSKSSLISGTSEKERNRIFTRFQDKIEELRLLIG